MNLSLILLFSALSAFAQTTTIVITNQPADLLVRRLEFIYPTNEVSDGLAVYVFSTQDITAPKADWPLVAVVTNLSTNTITNSVTVTIQRPYQFFTCRASNVFGMASDFTPVTPVYQPRTDLQERIR